VSVPPGWYKDPADPTVQRWWDGEGWVGDPLPADATPPPGPPPETAGTTPEPQVPAVPGMSGATETPPGPQKGERPVATKLRPDLAAPHAPGSRPAAMLAGAPPQPHGYALATPGARLLARLVDIALVFGLNVAVNGWLVYQLWLEIAPALAEIWQRALAGDTTTEGIPAVDDRAGNLLLAIVFITAALWFAYEVPSVANSGQTVGKRLLRIKVVRLESPDPLSFGRSFRRWWTMGFPTVLWWCLGIGFLLQLIDAAFVLFDRPLYQALHDKSAHTAVVAVPPGPGTPRTPHKEASDESADAS
jgi:uncharacterized RDD family membrane protein YckC